MMISPQDRLHNEMLLSAVQTEFRVGETLVLDGVSRVRITQVLPRGTVMVSAAKGWLPQSTGYGPVVCSSDVYLFVGLSADAPRRGQARAHHLRRMAAQRLLVA